MDGSGSVGRTALSVLWVFVGSSDDVGVIVDIVYQWGFLRLEFEVFGVVLSPGFHHDVSFIRDYQMV